MRGRDATVLITAMLPSYPAMPGRAGYTLAADQTKDVARRSIAEVLSGGRVDRIAVPGTFNGITASVAGTMSVLRF